MPQVKRGDMSIISKYLLTGRHLKVNSTKRGLQLDYIPFLGSIGKVLRSKKGSKLSRLFRHVFEHDKIKQFFGLNLGIAMFAATVVPTSNYIDTTADTTKITQSTLSLKTERGTQYPTTVPKISQGYRFYHPAIDIDGITGDPVYPIMSGTVESIQYSKYDYGNAVYVRHSANLVTLYAHLDKIFVNTGTEVTTGNQLGTMGATGRAYGDHLHLEVIENGIQINPMLLLP